MQHLLPVVFKHFIFESRQVKWLSRSRFYSNRWFEKKRNVFHRLVLNLWFFPLWNCRSIFFNPNKMTNQPKVLILGGNSNLKLFVFLFPLIQSIKICGFCFHSISQVGLNILFNKQLIATKMICVNLKKGRKTKRMSIIIKLHLIAVECVYALIPSHNICVFFFHYYEYKCRKTCSWNGHRFDYLGSLFVLFIQSFWRAYLFAVWRIFFHYMFHYVFNTNKFYVQPRPLRIVIQLISNWYCREIFSYLFAWFICFW